MAAILEKKVLEDELAVSLARAVAAANERARDEGIEVKQTLVTVSENSTQGDVCWRINYGPRSYVGRRGGIARRKGQTRHARAVRLRRGVIRAAQKRRHRAEAADPQLYQPTSVAGQELEAVGSFVSTEPSPWNLGL